MREHPIDEQRMRDWAPLLTHPTTIRMSFTNASFIVVISLMMMSASIWILSAVATPTLGERAVIGLLTYPFIVSCPLLLWCVASYKITVTDAYVRFSMAYRRATIGYHEMASVRYVAQRSQRIYQYWLLVAYDRNGTRKEVYIPLYMNRDGFWAMVSRIHNNAPEALPALPMPLEWAQGNHGILF